MANNGDTKRKFQVGADKIVGVGSFHKTLPHNHFGEVDPAAFDAWCVRRKGLPPLKPFPKERLYPTNLPRSL